MTHKTNNHYAALERYAQANDEIINIIMYNLATEPERKVNFIISAGLCKILLTYRKLHLDI